MGDAQAGGLDHPRHGDAAILHVQALGVETLGVPVRHLQAQGPAQQGLAGAQALGRAEVAAGIGVVQLHLRQAVRARAGVLPRIGRLDQHRVARPMGAEVQRVATARVIHIDVAAIEEQRLALFGVAERGVAAFVGEVVGLGFDDARGQPQVALAMADDFAQQGLGQGLGIAVEKAVGQGWHAGGSRLRRRG